MYVIYAMIYDCCFYQRKVEKKEKGISFKVSESFIWSYFEIGDTDEAYKEHGEVQFCDCVHGGWRGGWDRSGECDQKNSQNHGTSLMKWKNM